MKRGMDPVKVQLWHKRFARFKYSGQTVDRFCRDEGVSVPSFYLWRKKLAVGLAERNSWAQSAATAQKPLPNRQLLNRPLPKSRPASPFQPVELNGPSCDTAAGRGVTVRLPDGIEIAVGCDLLVIEQVVGQLLGRQQSGRGLDNGAAAC